MTEIWKYIEGTNGDYKVSNKGNVKSYLTDKDGKLLIPRKDKDGYLMVWTKYNSATKVHRVEAIAFLKNKDNYPVVNHIDGDKQNNKIENLEWCTVSYNTKHGYDVCGAYSAMSKAVGVYLENELLSVFNSCNECAKYLNVSRGIIESSLSNETTIFDGLQIKRLDGNQKKNLLYQKDFRKRKMTRYQSSPVSYLGVFYQSITELSEFLKKDFSTIQYYIKKNKPYKGAIIEKIPRYKYLID